MHAALGLALSTMIRIVVFLIGMCFEADGMSMAYVTFMSATLWCGMSIASCIGAHRIERGCGSMVCVSSCDTGEIGFLHVCADWHISVMATFGFGEQSWNSFVHLLLQVLFCSCESFCDHTFQMSLAFLALQLVFS